MTNRRREKVGAIAVAVVITLVLGACAGDDAGGSQGMTKLPNPTTGRTETGPVETGPMETGPTGTGAVETGPTVTGPVIGNTGNPYSAGLVGGLPPEGATPSKPLRGELVMEGSGSDLGYMYYVNLYADGRLIWARHVQGGALPGNNLPRWIEQRLTPEGVELLRSGAVPLGGEFENPAQGLPASAWEDRTFRPFVPWRYHACLSDDQPSLASLTLDFLPAEAKDLLSRSPWMDGVAGGSCREVTLEDARVLVEILSDAGFELIGDQRGERTTLGGPGMFEMVTDPWGNPPNYPAIVFRPVLPHGSSDYSTGF